MYFDTPPQAFRAHRNSLTHGRCNDRMVYRLPNGQIKSEEGEVSTNQIHHPGDHPRFDLRCENETLSVPVHLSGVQLQRGPPSLQASASRANRPKKRSHLGQGPEFLHASMTQCNVHHS